MNFGSNNFVKIEYAKDPQKRYKAYKTHNPTTKMLEPKLTAAEEIAS